MQIHTKSLFVATLLGAVLESLEVWNGSCAVWQQEFLLLAILLLLSLVQRGHQILMALATAGVLFFYGWEAYEQFWEGETCSPFASSLDPLLAATLLAAAGLALGHQMEPEAAPAIAAKPARSRRTATRARSTTRRRK